MSYKILTRRSSFLQRSITYEKDGKVDTISAPAATTTFDGLVARIEAGGSTAKNEEAPAEEAAPAASTSTSKKTSSKKKKKSA